MSSNIGKRLYEIRTSRNETQESVAESIGISYVSLSRYENGQRMPKMDILKRLADHYQVSIDDLMGNKPDVISTDPWDPENMDYAEKENDAIRILARGVTKMSPENRQKLLDVARVMFAEDFDEQGNKR